MQQYNDEVSVNGEALHRLIQQYYAGPYYISGGSRGGAVGAIAPPVTWSDNKIIVRLFPAFTDC